MKILGRFGEVNNLPDAPLDPEDVIEDEEAADFIDENGDFDEAKYLRYCKAMEESYLSDQYDRKKENW